MKKQFKWLALTSTLILSSYAAQTAQANEHELAPNVSTTVPSSELPAKAVGADTTQTSETSQGNATQVASSDVNSIPVPDSPETVLSNTADSQMDDKTAVNTSQTAKTDSETAPAQPTETEQSTPANQSAAADQQIGTTNQGQNTQKAAVDTASSQQNQASGKLTITNQNDQTGSFDVIISDIYAPDGIEEIKVPVWSAAGGQDDLRWYTAAKQMDNTYKVAVSISNHMNHLAEYYIHLYYLDRKGKLVGVGATSTNVVRSSDQPAGTLTTIPQNALTGDFDISIANIYAPNGLKSVFLPVWSEANGQDDIRWYEASAQSDGTYRASIKVAEHQGVLGNYYAHLYYKDQDNRLIGVTNQTVQVSPSQPRGKLEISNNNAKDGTFDVTVSDTENVAGIAAVNIPVWSKNNGQNDLVWYTADRQDNGTYKITVKASEHNYETGIYHAHLYYTQNDGSLIGVGAVDTEVSLAEPTGHLTVVNQDAELGNFDLIVSNISDPRGIKEVLIPVWSETKGQNDLIWHTASRQEDGTYKASIKVSDHQYETGSYTAHLYYLRNDGSLANVAEAKTQVELAPASATLTASNINEATGSFELTVSDILAPTGLKSVNIPVWSDTGGQDDLVWYTASRQEDGTYKTAVIAANHKYTSGTYWAHLYFIDALGNLVPIAAQTSVNLNLPEQTGVVSVSSVNQSNWSFDVNVSHVGAKAGVKQVQVAVWSDSSGQDDLKWYTAVRQPDGIYKAVVRLANHKYSSGTYHTHVYYTLNDNSFTGAAATSTDIAVTAPRAQIQQELASLHGQFNQLFAGVGGQKSLYITPADGTEALLINDGTQRSASTIKLFILASFYAKAARGEIDPNQSYTINPAEIVTASVNLGNAGGQTFSLAQLANYMVQTSDNTATNIIMKHIGGVEAVNDEIRRLGYTQTRMERYMHDATAINAGKDNYISAQEAGDLLKNIYNRTLINQSVDTTMLNNLGNNYYPLWLTANIKNQATVYNKPGNHTGHGVENDIAVIAKNGRAYIIAILTQGTRNQNTAIRNLGSAVYNELIN